MRIRLTPFDPARALLEQISKVLREGIADCAVITPQPPPAWASADTAAPAGHQILPAGSMVYSDRDPDTITCKDGPAVMINAPEDGKERSEEVLGAWLIAVEIKVRAQGDYSLTELDSIIDAIAIILTQPIVYDDDTREQPQTRLSAGNLRVLGADWTQNFFELGISKMNNEEGHPERTLAFKVVCGIAPETP